MLKVKRRKNHRTQPCWERLQVVLGFFVPHEDCFEEVALRVEEEVRPGFSSASTCPSTSLYGILVVCLGYGCLVAPLVVDAPRIFLVCACCSEGLHGLTCALAPLLQLALFSKCFFSSVLHSIRDLFFCPFGSPGSSYEEPFCLSFFSPLAQNFVCRFNCQFFSQLIHFPLPDIFPS